MREATERRWSSLAELNEWLQSACRDAWEQLSHPEWPELSIADVWQDEASRLMPCPKPFDGYVEHPVRVSSTSLIQYQRNRYSVPCEWVHGVVSLRVYPDYLFDPNCFYGVLSPNRRKFQTPTRQRCKWVLSLHF